jgi:nucleotide-binding universal stress UspA family protein
MPGIICAIRGGPLSQPTIRQAILTAGQYKIPIHFLYVVNLDFLEHTEHSRMQVIKQEMRSMGEFICLKAQIEAGRDNVESTVFVREGNVLEEIIALCHEVKADYVILGLPQGEDESNLFNLDRLKKISQMIEAETETEVIFARGA